MNKNWKTKIVDEWFNEVFDKEKTLKEVEEIYNEIDHKAKINIEVNEKEEICKLEITGNAINILTLISYIVKTLCENDFEDEYIRFAVETGIKEAKLHE